MGVPAFFRWLSNKYPKIISPVVEEEPTMVGDAAVPPQYLLPNPNGELDNLYLDMNGIVHPCSHPENKPAPETEEEMLLEVFRYTDRVLMMARPRKVLMIAVDGVAPRAKMNQQRQRRFRSAQDAKVAAIAKEEELREREQRGEVIDEAVKNKRLWDLNAITPGTPFMDKLATALRYWTAYKLSLDPGWAQVQVIILDALVPGEGEHKIMNFIRSQRADPQHDPNTTHAIYGLDADLIFLGLATHEPHFRILREDVFAVNNRSRNRHNTWNMLEAEAKRVQAEDEKKPFLWLHVNVLREYLEVELQPPPGTLLFPFELERAIDDWVFMCFFVGNDFLPHLPLLGVRDSGIDAMVQVWKQVLPLLEGYITCDGVLDVKGVAALMNGFAPQEPGILRKKWEKEQSFQRLRRDGGNKRFRGPPLPNAKPAPALINQEFSSQLSKGRDRAPVEPLQLVPLYLTQGESVGEMQLSNSELVANRATILRAANFDNQRAASLLKDLLKKKDGADGTADGAEVSDASETAAVGTKRPLDDSEASSPASTVSTANEDLEEDEDPVRLHEPGYHLRYYRAKFHVAAGEEDEMAKKVASAYIEGILWVLLYYYQGCPLWGWYFPYHYAPFAGDFAKVEMATVEFAQLEPFRPYEQLMSVLPAALGHNLPEIFRPLMLEPDLEIVDFYPEDFEIDMNGAKMLWMGIALLPFIDEKRLLRVVRSKYHLLTDNEKYRNQRKKDVLLVLAHHKRFQQLKEVYAAPGTPSDLHEDEWTHAVAFGAHTSGLAGTVGPLAQYTPGLVMPFPYKGEVNDDGRWLDLHSSSYLQLNYRMPVKECPGKLMLLTGYVLAERVLTPSDVDSIRYARNGGGRNYFRTNFTVSSDYVNRGKHGTNMYPLGPGGFKAFVKGVQGPLAPSGPRGQQRGSSYAPGRQFSGDASYNDYRGGPRGPPRGPRGPRGGGYPNQRFIQNGYGHRR